VVGGSFYRQDNETTWFVKTAWRTTMKAAFGILALYVAIPLAIVASQRAVTHEAAVEQNAAHAVVAQAVPAAPIPARH
jgi:hypothetical protein